MGDKSAIEWTDATWNPLRGCSRVSAGCMNCYAERVAHRFNGPGRPYEGLTSTHANGIPRWNGKIKLVPELLDQPLRWRRPRRIFVNSMSDLFHESVPTEYIDRVFAVMALCGYRHTFQILTKRAARMQAYCTSDETLGRIAATVTEIVGNSMLQLRKIDDGMRGMCLENVWLGVSVEDQASADERIPLLLQTPAAVRWISAEPLIGAVELDQWLTIHKHWLSKDSLPKAPWHPPYPKHWWKPQALVGAGWKCPLHWVVAGGESGPSARPSHPDWFRSLRDQCKAAAVPFHFKQWGEHAPNWYNDGSGKMIPGSEWMDRMGKKAAGRLLDGVLHDEYPCASAGRISG